MSWMTSFINGVFNVDVQTIFNKSEQTADKKPPVSLLATSKKIKKLPLPQPVTKNCKALGAKKSDIQKMCMHNEKEGVSGDDLLEHAGNGEWGSLWRDWCEKTKSDKDPVTGQERENDSRGAGEKEHIGSDVNSTDRSLWKLWN